MLVEKNVKRFYGLFLLFVIFFSLSTELPRRQHWGFFSDEAGYFAITQSLVHDGDLKYTRGDLTRIKKDFPTGPVGVFLKKGTDGELYYAKSFAYPLAAAPFFAVFGVRGLLLFNGLMIFFALLMGYLLLRQYHPPGAGFTSALVFILASVTPVYIWWLTADLFNFFVMFAGLFFFFYTFKHSRLFYISALFFALAGFSKPWNLAAIGIIYLVLLFQGRWKRFLLLTLTSMALFALPVFFLYTQTGDLSYKLYMGGERRSFTTCFPYDSPDCTFESGARMSFDNYWERFHTSPKIMGLNFFYFFFGRFTGVFIYFFPAVFLLILFFFRPKIPGDYFVLGAIVTAILVFTLLAPDNYFGGSGAVGNRYFFNIYPLFFFLGFRQRSFKFSLIPVVVALVLLSGVYIDSLHHSTTPRTAGLSFPINRFPPEKTQYLSLPTNENPRAFGKLGGSGAVRYQIYLLNDNYHPVEPNGAIWTNGAEPVEFFMAVPGEVETFSVTLESKTKGNRVSLWVEDQHRRLILDPGREYVVRFKHIEGLTMKNKTIYHIKIKCSRSFNGAMATPAPPDRRDLGVKILVGVKN